MNTFTLKTEKQSIELKQYEVISAKLLDDTRSLLEAYKFELLSDTTILGNYPQAMTLIKTDASDYTEQDRATLLEIINEASKIYAPIGTAKGIEIIIDLAIAISDLRQLTTEQKKVVTNKENWKSLDVDLDEVVKYVQFFRNRVIAKRGEG
jgi:hypothetical protein